MFALKQLDRILRGEAFRDASAIQIALGPLAILNVILAAVYGACLGAFAVFGREESEWRQVIASAVKLPLLFVVTLAVTFPSLCVFESLMGSRFRLLDLARVVLAGISVIVACLASFGPIIAFFSVSATSYSFILLLNVAVFALSGFFGLAHLFRAVLMPAQREAHPEAEPRSSHEDSSKSGNSGIARLFMVWVVVFGLVGAQSGWILRPFVGSPEMPFTWFRPKQGSFFEGVGKSLENVFLTRSQSR